jgi:uncharacterized linocin/CFP29 family protein
MDPVIETGAALFANAAPTVKDRLIAFNFDPGCLRPWFDPPSGRTYVTIMEHGQEKHIAINANTTLTKDAWKQLDAAILRAAVAPLRVVADLRAAGLTYNIPNGMGKTVLEYQRMTDVNDAMVTMDPSVIGENDRPEFDLNFLPLPVTHKGFHLNIRELAASRNSNMPLDTGMGELSARKVAEMVEKITLGTATGATYGGGTVYGLTNFGSRLLKTLTSPASTGWTAVTTLAEVLAMKQQSKDAKHYGPWMLYFSSAWDQYIDNDMSTSYPNKTLRMRLREIDGIQDARTSNWLSSYDVVLVEMTTETVRMVIGLELMTLEWQELGGLRTNFKVMTIQVPQIRADIADNCGVVHGSV